MSLFACLALMWPLHFLLPVYQYVHEPLAYAGIIPLFAGIAMAALAAGKFVKAETGLLPFEEATTLITDGFFRFTRNPMYLGMILMLLGVAFLLGSLGALIPVLLFISRRPYSISSPVSLAMERAFGQQYRDYKIRVRRWI